MPLYYPPSDGDITTYPKILPYIYILLFLDRVGLYANFHTFSGLYTFIDILGARDGAGVGSFHHYVPIYASPLMHIT